MSHSFAGCASTARSTFPTSVRRTISQDRFRRQLRTFLAVPLRQQGNSLEALNARRIEVRPFTPAQIKLLETFADQAVIAIENVRLFQELKESLEQQTATSEILGVIASSPTDDSAGAGCHRRNAARVCEANDAVIRLVEGDVLRIGGPLRSVPNHCGRAELRPATRLASEPCSMRKRSTSMT